MEPIMNISSLFSSLKTAVLSAAVSLGGALLAGLATIGIGFTSDMKSILVKTITKFHDGYETALAAGKGELEAIEEGATAARNEFCSDMQAEGAKESDAIITLLTSSFKNALD
jgi:hypothetical protein